MGESVPWVGTGWVWVDLGRVQLGEGGSRNWVDWEWVDLYLGW
ncbi:hypothetical protein BVRB_7g168300 [Beta vulgaris subsp. vulgaris]|uniref:Uncharacterized protein n=1 Tax=Beta vulgaris subsp. vulgaris TaxID=3555 RepID=A0A0J8BWQ1_BETVV|nr:hypothetical protein BVRB_7g168300 [Beta vulgaris subsp. vulgaris]